MAKISIEHIKGNLRLRWQIEEKRYCLSLGLKDTPTNRAAAQMKAGIIDRDIEYQMFDPTLAEYRLDGYGSLAAKAWELFEKFIKSKQGNVYKQTLSKYYGLLTRIKTYFRERQARAIDKSDAEKFKVWLSERLKPLTVKERLTMLKAAWDWAIERHMVRENPWTGLAKRVPRGVVKPPHPFSVEEIRLIVTGFRERPQYSHHADYVEFLLGTGCRIGEAIALVWGDVSADCSQVWFGKTYYRGDLKGLKAGKPGYVPMSRGLQQLLHNRRPKKTDPESLIFTAPRGGYIDDKNFLNRYWKPLLAELGVTYRKPYTTRKTLISYWLSQGEDPLIVAQHTRTSVRMIYQHYAGFIPSKATLPNLLGDVFAPTTDD